jgi:ComF family protein
MKPDVLKQIKEIEEQREKMIKEEMAKQQAAGGQIMLQQPGKPPMVLNNQQIVEVIQQQQQQLQLLGQKAEDYERMIQTLKMWGVSEVTITGESIGESKPEAASVDPAVYAAITSSVERHFRRSDLSGPFVKELVRHILHRIKYERSPYLADDLVAAAATDEPFRRHLAGSILVPVPLHTEKAWSRGYNQSERIAAGLAQRIAGCTVAPLLEKHAATESQTRLDRSKRLRNVAKAFRLKRGHTLDPQRRYVVIDDVLTTGATLHACAAVLRAAGAASVDAAALAHG